MSEAPLRVAIAGCGLIAGGPVREGRPIRGTHAEAARSLEGVSLVAAADPDEARRTAFARHWGLDEGRVYADVEAMLAAHEPSILVVATPHETHEALCMRAIERGVPAILCEKPFTGEATRADRIVRAARDAGCHLAVNFSRRWDATHRALAARIAAGELGELRAMYGTYTGTLRGNGAHWVDLLHMLAPGSFHVEHADGVAPGERDGAAGATLRGAGGLRAFLAPVEQAGYFVFETTIVGTKGRARLLFGGNDVRVDRPAPHADYPGYLYLEESERLPGPTLPASFREVLAALVRAVRTGEPLPVDPRAHVDAMRLLDQIIERAHASAHPTQTP